MIFRKGRRYLQQTRLHAQIQVEASVADQQLRFARFVAHHFAQQTVVQLAHRAVAGSLQRCIKKTTITIAKHTKPTNSIVPDPHSARPHFRPQHSRRVPRPDRGRAVSRGVEAGTVVVVVAKRTLRDFAGTMLLRWTMQTRRWAHAWSRIRLDARRWAGTCRCRSWDLPFQSCAPRRPARPECPGCASARRPDRVSFRA